MKKSLYMTSALVAAGVLALGSTGAMAKAKPLKAGVSGSYKAVVGYSKQQSAFEVVGTGTTATSYNELDVKTDSEVHFKGSTKLDNGLSVSIKVELEGDQETGADIDASSLTVSGTFGQITLGADVAAAAILSVAAPSTGAIGAAGGGDSRDWIQKPAAVVHAGVEGHNIGGADAMKIRWISNSFSGFKIGASYVPSTTAGTTMPQNGGTAGTNAAQIDGGIKYSGKMGSNAVNVAFTRWATDAGTASQTGWTAGADAAFGAIKVGVAYLDVADEGKNADGSARSGTANSVDAEAMAAGVSYVAGPMTIAMTYFNHERPLASGTAGDDAVTKWTLGTTYNMGPGVDFIGSIQQVSWQDETAAAASNNKGVAIVGGLKVAF